MGRDGAKLAAKPQAAPELGEIDVVAPAARLRREEPPVPLIPPAVLDAAERVLFSRRSEDNRVPSTRPGSPGAGSVEKSSCSSMPWRARMTHVLRLAWRKPVAESAAGRNTAARAIHGARRIMPAPAAAIETPAPPLRFRP